MFVIRKLYFSSISSGMRNISVVFGFYVEFSLREEIIRISRMFLTGKFNVERISDDLMKIYIGFLNVH